MDSRCLVTLALTTIFPMVVDIINPTKVIFRRCNSKIVSRIVSTVKVRFRTEVVEVYIKCLAMETGKGRIIRSNPRPPRLHDRFRKSQRVPLPMEWTNSAANCRQIYVVVKRPWLVLRARKPPEEAR
jgi:hypothetical protein